jgi:MFS family permease
MQAKILSSKNTRSLRALDWLNFSMADVLTGLGPFLAIYLTASRHWNPAQVGIVLSAQGLATVAAQVPAGELIDASRRKRWLIAAAATAVALGCIATISVQRVAWMVVVQVLVGIAAAVFPIAIAAVSLGIVGKQNLAARVGRNEAFNHAGNLTFALLAGVIGTYISQASIFYASAFLAIGTVAAALAIRERDIDHKRARGADEETFDSDRETAVKTASWRALLADRRIPIFAASVVLFHFANAAMLPLVGELLSIGRPRDSSFFMSACILVAQLVMVPVALVTGKVATRGRKFPFVVGFGVLVLRGVLYTLSHNSLYLVAVQSLDGIGAAVFGVLWVLITADLTKGTGRFNTLQGAIQACLGIGAFLSNFIAGFVVKNLGYNVGFLILAAIAVAGLALFYLAMPETKASQPWHRAARPIAVPEVVQ